MIACYTRVSTADQTLDRQIDATQQYAREQLGADVADIQIYVDKSTGTDVDRSGYREMMADAESGELQAVVAHEISRICRSIGDLERTVDRLKEYGVELHVVSEGLTIKPDANDPFNRAMVRLLGVFAELEADIRRQNTREGIAARQQSEDYHHGRPPLGFNKQDGELIPAPNYHDVIAVLEMVQRGDLSKRKAAEELGTSRSTITRALDRAELYGLT
jgi:DNA invertase Pin-like site-specific DNA recombinase